MIVNTVAHEAWHAYQYQCAENPKTKKDMLYVINFRKFISPLEYDGSWILFDEYEKHPDIASELEHWIVTKKYVTEKRVVVKNYTAENLAALSEFLDGEGAFAMLIQLREKPRQALKKDGFMLR